jgi:DNA-binding transcriptional LysR family regulator
MHSFDWSDLQYVLAVAEEGSLASAARKLGVNHATVLRRIRGFEDRHDLTLFERRPNGYRLAPEYAYVLSEVRKMSSDAERLERMLAGQTGGFRGSLTITTTDSLSRALMPSVLSKFRAIYPDVVVTLSVTNNVLDLSRLDADITVRPAAGLPENLAGERVADLGFRVYGASDYFAKIQRSEPAGYTWLGPGATLARSPVGRWLSQSVPEAAVAMRLNSFSAMADAVAEGMGLAMLPCCLGDAMPGIERADEFDELLTTGIWVLSHEDMLRSSRIRAFLSTLGEAVAEHGDLLIGNQSAGS